MTTTTARLGLALLLLSCTSLGLYDLDRPPGSPHPDADAIRSVEALVSAPGSQARAALPATFADEIGYTPTLEHGHLVNPGGSCSSPVPLPTELETACREHDLGYDLLRHAQATGSAPPPGARAAVDDHFRASARRACERRPSEGSRTSCTVWAEIAATAVRLNSWRQHDAAPVREDAMSVATGASGAGAVLTGGALAAGLLRRFPARLRTLLTGWAAR